MVTRAVFLIMPSFLLLIPFVARPAHPEPPSAMAEQTRPQEPIAPRRPGGIRIRNQGAAPVKVEVGVANDGDCVGSGKTVASQTLEPASFWVIFSSQPICVRREVGGEQGQFRPWEKKVPTEGQVEEVTL